MRGPVPTAVLSGVELLAAQPDSMGCFPPCSHHGTAEYPRTPLAAQPGLGTNAHPGYGQGSRCSPQQDCDALVLYKGVLGHSGEPCWGGWQPFPTLGLLICCCAEKIGHQSAFEGELITDLLVVGPLRERHLSSTKRMLGESFQQ